MAYAHVLIDGLLDTPNSKNVAQANVTHPASGIYCIAGLAFNPRNPIVTLGPNGLALAADVGYGPGVNGCAAGTQLTVRTYDAGGVFTDNGFFLSINS